MSSPKHYFLYAEDDPDDQEHFIEVVKKISPEYEAIVCNHGLALLNFLEGLESGDFLPCCIILDINMPVMDGLTALAELKKHPVFHQLPVVMFTTSQMQRDKAESSALGADDFITKPVTEKELAHCIQKFASYCMKTVDQMNKR